MRCRPGLIAIAALLLVPGCGGNDPAEEFNPTVAEEFIQDKAVADVRSDPALTLKQPEEPVVMCDLDEAEEVAEASRFLCDVTIAAEGGEQLGTQTWEAIVERDPGSSDALVRSVRRLESSIDPAPVP